MASSVADTPATSRSFFDSEQGVAAADTLFSGGLLAWWQEKVARAAPDKKETAGYDGITTLAADILNAFVSTDRQGDAFKNMNNLHRCKNTLLTIINTLEYTLSTHIYLKNGIN